MTHTADTSTHAASSRHAHYPDLTGRTAVITGGSRGIGTPRMGGYVGVTFRSPGAARPAPGTSLATGLALAESSQQLPVAAAGHPIASKTASGSR
jgi:hypothetical protein